MNALTNASGTVQEGVGGIATKAGRAFLSILGATCLALFIAGFTRVPGLPIGGNGPLYRAFIVALTLIQDKIIAFPHVAAEAVVRIGGTLQTRQVARESEGQSASDLIDRVGRGRICVGSHLPRLRRQRRNYFDELVCKGQR